MGIIFSVMLVDDEMVRDESFKNWLGEETEIPEDYRPSRWPTVNELKRVLESLENCRVFYTSYPGGLRIEITNTTHVPFGSLDRSTSGQDIVIWNYSGNDDEQQQFHFDKLHHEKISFTVLKKLSEFCGTFLVTYDGEDPSFITPNMKNYWE